jgi:alpha-glucosidase
VTEVNSKSVTPIPPRTDEEMHNLNFVLYSGQMIKDFEAHTKRRGFVLSTGGWTGFQRYPGTWAGDTGTGSTVLCGMLQTALVGHSCTTCDMEIDSPEHMHMGLLTAWAHINSWDYCRYPVYRGDVLLNAFRDYINLRMRLLPLYYSLAWEGTRNGMPIMRPMLLTYPDREEAYSLSRQYLLGDAFLVSVFGKTITLPDGKWFDWWTGSIHKGDWSEREIEFPNDRGGHLMVRYGSVFPMREVQLHTGERPLEKITWVVFPDAASGKFTLYLDNGIDLTYREGSYAAAQFTCEPTKDGFILQWHPIEGNEPGRIRMLTYDIELLALSGTTQISVDGKPVQAEYDTKRNRIVIRGTKYGQVIRVMV